MAIIKDPTGVKVIVVNTGLSGIYLNTFLDPNNTTACQQEITRNMTSLVLSAAIRGSKIGVDDSILKITNKNPLLIPVLRAALPMYVVAQTMFPSADTALVRCKKTKGLMGKDSVAVNWMGRKAFAVGKSEHKVSVAQMHISPRRTLATLNRIFLEDRR